MVRRLKISDNSEVDTQFTYLYCAQFATTIIFLLVFGHIWYKVKNLQQFVKECEQFSFDYDDEYTFLDGNPNLTNNGTSNVPAPAHLLGPVSWIKHAGRIKHRKRHLAEPDDTDNNLFLRPDTIIPLKVLQQTCDKVHEECTAQGRKLRGYPGRQGRPGMRGRIGLPGRVGRPGVSGDIGPPGDVGEEGPDGRDGRCNCTLPDMYVHSVAVPGPPVIQITEVVRTVPVIIIKEVPINASLVTPPHSAINNTTFGTTGRPPLLAHTSPAETNASTSITGSSPTSTTTSTTVTTTTTIPYTGPPTLGTNKKRCVLDAVGIPVLHAESQYGQLGSWMRDALPPSHDHSQKRWVTDEYASAVLYEYKNEHELLGKRQLIKYYVNYLAAGTGSAVYNNSYFYHRHNSNRIVRYDLNSSESVQHVVFNMAYADCQRQKDETFLHCNSSDHQKYLYDQPHNFVDFAVDENGLWFTHTWADESWLVVNKIEPLENEFYLVSTWNIKDVNASSFANTFIMCGVLYGLERGNVRDSRISFAYDLYEDRVLENVSVAWYNPYKKNTMLDYNPIDKRIYFYDDGRLLSVNVRTKIDGTDSTAQPEFDVNGYGAQDLDDF